MCTESFTLAEELSDSYSSDANVSDIPGKENLLKMNGVRVRKRNQKFASDDEDCYFDNEKVMY
jgi:hypothetical protein